MSNTLTAESKVYANRAKDLQRQVGSFTKVHAVHHCALHMLHLRILLVHMRQVLGRAQPDALAVQYGLSVLGVQSGSLQCFGTLRELAGEVIVMLRQRVAPLDLYVAMHRR